MTADNPVSRATIGAPDMSNHQHSPGAGFTVIDRGGAMRIQTGHTPSPTLIEAQTEIGRNVGALNRVSNHADGATTAETGGLSRTTAGPTIDNPSAPIASTIRSPFGTPRSGLEVRDSDLVDVGGITTTVGSAKAAGLLHRDGSGNWHAGTSANETGQAPITAPKQFAPGEQQPEEQQVVSEALRLDEDSEALASAFASRVDPHDSQQAINALMEGRSIPDDLAGRAGSTLGLQPEEVRERVETLRSAFERQAQSVANERALDWARNARPDALKEAVREQVNHGSVKGYEALSREYISALPSIDPQVVLNSPHAAERGVKLHRNGSITVEIPGVGQMEWKAAIRAGFIAPHFPKR